MNVSEINKKAWNRLVQEKNRWAVPVSPEEIARARAGDFKIVLTPTKPVPLSWLSDLKGKELLCLAGGGGQQGPILSAIGARFTVFDNSPEQLKQDELVAKRDGLDIRTVEGDMKDLSAFRDEFFDFIFHPCSNCFCDDILPLWREAFRVLRPGGTMLAGFCNPLIFLFDPELEKQNILQLKFGTPYSDISSVTAEERQRYFGDAPLSFGHSLQDQIGGQNQAGFHITSLYEDDWGGAHIGDRYVKGFMATRSVKPRLEI